jgi:hypothetical protein
VHSFRFSLFGKTFQSSTNSSIDDEEEEELWSPKKRIQHYTLRVCCPKICGNQVEVKSEDIEIRSLKCLFFVIRMDVKLQSKTPIYSTDLKVGMKNS